MGIFRKKKKSAAPAEMPGVASLEGEPREHLDLLKSELGLEMTSAGWVFDGAVISDYQSQLTEAETCLGIVDDLREKSPFDRLCVVAGNVVVLVGNSKPRPFGITTALGTDGISQVLTRLITRGDGPVVEHRGCWMVTLR